MEEKTVALMVVWMDARSAMLKAVSLAGYLAHVMAACWDDCLVAYSVLSLAAYWEHSMVASMVEMKAFETAYDLVAN